MLEHYFSAGELAGKTVLDAGCRVGDYSAALLRQGACHVTGVDLSGRCIEEATRRYSAQPELEFFQADISELGRFPESSFDLVFCAGTMAYLSPQMAQRAVRELIRVVQPGGTVLILFLRDRGPLFRLATWVVDRIPLRLYRVLVETFGFLMHPIAPLLVGHPVGKGVLKNDVLWGLQGLHYGVPLAIPEAFQVETVQCEFCAPTTSVSYKIQILEKPALWLPVAEPSGLAPAGSGRFRLKEGKDLACLL